MTGHSYKVTIRVGWNADITDEETEILVSRQVWEALNKVMPTKILSIEKEGKGER